MALISQNFKNDTSDTGSAFIEPVVVLAKKNTELGIYEPFDIFSTNNITLKDHLNNTIHSKEILENISSIKNSIDINSRKLKINTFRFSILNYYDITQALTNSDSYRLQDNGSNPINSLVGSFVILYYKTSSTKVLNFQLQQNIEDDHCPIIFQGIVNRVKQTDQKITFQAEDYIQTYLSDKLVPRTRVSDTTLDGWTETELERIPCVFGKVEKSPIVEGKGLQVADVENILGSFDTTIFTQYKGFKKGSDDWLGTVYSYNNPGWDHINDSQAQPNPYVSDVIPEVGAGVPEETTGQLGYGIARHWYKYGDSSGTNPIFQAAEDNLDSYLGDAIIPSQWEDIFYSGSTHNHQDGRWILLHFPRPIKMWRFETLTQLNFYNSYVSPENINSIGTELYFKPLNGLQWKDIIKNGGELADILEDTIIDEENFSYLKSGYGIQRRDSDGLGVFSLGGNTSGDIKKIIYPPYSGYSTIINNFNKSDEEVDRLLIFEYFNDGSEDPITIQVPASDDGSITVNENQNSGVYKGASINSLECVYEEQVSKTAQVYGNVNGRVDLMSCENPIVFNQILEWQQLGITQESVELDYLIKGVDQYTPANFTQIQDAIENTFINLDIESGQTYFEFGGNEEEWITLARTDFLYTNMVKAMQGITDVDWEDIFEDPENQYYSTAYAPTEIYDADDNLILRLPYVIGWVLQFQYRKLWHNAIEKEVVDWLEYKNSVGEPVYKGPFTYNSSTGSYQIPEGSELEEYDHATENINAMDYQTWFSQIASVVTRAVASSGFPGSALNGIIPEEPTHFRDLWLNNYHQERKSLIRRFLKYIYQAPLHSDPSSDNFFQDNYGADPFTYDWTIAQEGSFGSTEISRWVYNLQSYIDDTISTINKSVWDFESTEKRSELYVWDTSALSWSDPDFASHNSDENVYIEEGASSLINMLTYQGSQFPYQWSSDGYIMKPIDVIYNILLREMKFGIMDNDFIDVSLFDQVSMDYNRSVYSDWKMGFSVFEEVSGKRLIEDILSETRSFFVFSPEGKFTFITIKDSYTYEDIDRSILVGDCIKAKFDKTKKEDLVLQSRMFYSQDYGYDRFNDSTEILKIEDLIDGYNGYDFYGLDQVTGLKEKNLKYHTDPETVAKLQRFDLLNNCNQHLTVDLELPLSYAGLSIGNIIHIPLINDERVFGLDYSKIQHLNNQPIYPLWIITSVDLKMEKVVIKAYQLHYLNDDGLHGFVFPEGVGENIAFANLLQFNSQFPEIHNWNYLPPYHQDPDYVYVQDVEIPYGDVNGDQAINVQDMLQVMNHILGNSELTSNEKRRIVGYDFNNKEIIAYSDEMEPTVTHLMDLCFIITGVW